MLFLLYILNSKQWYNKDDGFTVLFPVFRDVWERDKTDRDYIYIKTFLNS